MSTSTVRPARTPGSRQARPTKGAPPRSLLRTPRVDWVLMAVALAVTIVHLVRLAGRARTSPSTD